MATSCFLYYVLRKSVHPQQKQQKLISVRSFPLETWRTDVQKTSPLHRSHSGLNVQPDLTTFGFGTYTSLHSQFLCFPVHADPPP